MATSSRVIEEKEMFWAYEGNQVVCEAELGAREVAVFGAFSRSW